VSPYFPHNIFRFWRHCSSGLFGSLLSLFTCAFFASLNVPSVGNTLSPLLQMAGTTVLSSQKLSTGDGRLLYLLQYRLKLPSPTRTRFPMVFTMIGSIPALLAPVSASCLGTPRLPVMGRHPSAACLITRNFSKVTLFGYLQWSYILSWWLMAPTWVQK